MDKKNKRSNLKIFKKSTVLKDRYTLVKTVGIASVVIAVSMTSLVKSNHQLTSETDITSSSSVSLEQENGMMLDNASEIDKNSLVSQALPKAIDTTLSKIESAIVSQDVVSDKVPEKIKKIPIINENKESSSSTIIEKLDKNPLRIQIPKTSKDNKKIEKEVVEEKNEEEKSDISFNHSSKAPSHIHQYNKISTKYVINEDNTHTLVTIGECEKDGSTKVLKEEVFPHQFEDPILDKETGAITEKCACGYVHVIVDHHEYIWTAVDENQEKGVCVSCNDEKYRPHTMNDWIYAGNQKDKLTCNTCDYSVERDHIHSLPPEELEYTLKQSNHNKTHQLKANYTCDICHENVEVLKDEDCDYERSYRIFSTYNSYNQHETVDTCKVCNDEQVKKENCIKIGDKQYISINGYVYEYYKCELCNGYVDREHHTTHTFGEWEQYEDYHIRYCGCIEGREKGKHEFEFIDNPDGDGLMATCKVCGYSVITKDHEHAPDNMDMMDLVMSPYFYDLVSFSLIANPNRSYDEYCVRYDLRCSTCKLEYSIHYDHQFEDGACIYSGYCDLVEPVNYEMLGDVPNDENDLETDKEKVYTLKK